MEQEQGPIPDCFGVSWDPAAPGCRVGGECGVAAECGMAYRERMEPAADRIRKLGYDPDVYANIYPEVIAKARAEHPKDERKQDTFIKKMLGRERVERDRRLEEEELRIRAERKKVQQSGPPRTRRRILPPLWWTENPFIWRTPRRREHLTMLEFIYYNVITKTESDRLARELEKQGMDPILLMDRHTGNLETDRFWSYPLALFKFNYKLAEQERGWNDQKSYRLLRRLCEEGMLKNVGLLGGKGGQKVYALGTWNTASGTPRVQLWFKDDCHKKSWRDKNGCGKCVDDCWWVRKFMAFRATGFTRGPLLFPVQIKGGYPKIPVEIKGVSR